MVIIILTLIFNLMWTSHSVKIVPCSLEKETLSSLFYVLFYALQEQLERDLRKQIYCFKIKLK